MMQIHVSKKAFGAGQTVISDLNIGLSAGEFVAFLAPSGAGKSTLLNLISGIDEDFEGDISIQGNEDGKPVIGMMFQEPRLMPWLTVKQNVALVVEETREMRLRVEEVLALTGLADEAEKFPNELSGGMKKRVALARAFMPKPNLLLIDEPFSSLDAPAAEQLRQQLVLLCSKYQVTLIYVTHNLPEAISLADRILFFSSGPMRLLKDIRVELDRPRRMHDSAVQQLQARLLEQAPKLLEGIVQ